MAITAAQLNVRFTSEGADRVKGDITSVGGAVDNVGKKGSALGGLMSGIGAALAVPMTIGLTAAIDLEQAMANLNASLGGLDTSTLSNLSSVIQDIGANSQYSAIEVAAIADSLAKAGFSVEDLMGGMTQAVVDLAQATGDGLTPAVDGVVQAMSMWAPGIVGSTNAMTDAARVADILTVAANQSSAGIGDIIAGMRPLGPVAASMGIGFDEASAAIAMFTNFGLSGAEAGISLARGLQNLANPTSEASNLMAELGISAFDAQGSFIGFPELFRQLQAGMGGMSDQAQLMALSTIFGAEAMDVMGLAILSGADPLEAMIALMQESGAAAEQSALRMDTLKAQFDSLKEGVTTLLGSLVQGLIPGLRWLVDGANAVVDVLMQIPPPVKTVIGAVLSLIAVIGSLSVGIGVFGNITSLMGGMGIAAGGLGVSLSPLVGILAAIGIASGALYAAWRTDFLGMRGVINQVLDPLRTFTSRVQTGFRGVINFIDRFRRAFSGVDRPVRSATSAVSGFASLLGRGLERVAGFFEPMVPLADAMSGATAGIAKSVTTIGDAVGYAAAPMDDMREFIQQTSDAATSLGRVFDSLAIAIRGINGGNIPDWLSGLADAFEAASDFVDQFMARFQYMRNFLLSEGASPLEAFIGGLRLALSGIDIGQVVIRIGSWLFSTARDLASDLWSWVAATALPAVGTAIGTIAAVTVAIGGWVFQAATSIWDALQRWWSTGSTSGLEGDGTGGSRPTSGFKVQLGTIAAEVGGWAIESAVSVWDAVTSWWNGGSGPTGGGVPTGMLGGGGGSGAVGGFKVRLGVIAAEVGGWLISAATSVWDAVTAWWNGSGGGGTGQPPGVTGGLASGGSTGFKVQLGTVAAEIGDWTISSTVSIATRLSEWIFGEDFTAVGTTTSSKVMAAISTAFSAGTAAGGATGGVFNIGASIIGWVERQIDGLNADGVGQKVGNAIGASLTKVFGSAGVFQAAANAFGAGFITAVGDEVDGSGFSDRFWSAFDGLATFSGDVFEGVAEGFLNSLRTSILGEDGSLDFGPITVKIGAIEFDGALADAFREAFINAAVPGGTFLWDILNLGSDDGGGDGEDDGGGASGSTSGRNKGWLNNVGNSKPKFSVSGMFDGIVEGATQAIEKVKGVVSGGMSEITASLTNGAATATAAYATLIALIGPATDKPMMAAQMAVALGMAAILLAMVNGAATATTAYGSLMAQVGPATQKPFMSAQMTVSSAMNAIIARVANGAATAVSSFGSIMGQLPGIASGAMTRVQFAIVGGMRSAAGAIAGMAGSFYGAGQDAMTGLVGGVNSRLGALQDVVSRAIAIMAQIPALGNSPWPMMIGAGEDAVDGLVIGWDRRLPRLASTVGDTIDLFGIAPAIDTWGGRVAPVGAYAASVPVTSSSQPQTVIYQQFDITLQADTLEEVIAVREFLADLPRARQVVLGPGRR